MTTSTRAAAAPAFRPKRFAWRGRVPARALFFASPSVSPFGVPDVAARILAHWRSGARLLAVDGGLLLIWAQDAFVDARTSDGQVFVDVDGALSAIPLGKREREAHVARGDLVTAAGGVARCRPLSSFPEVPAGALVDVSAFAVVDVASLAAPAPVIPPPAPAARVNARAALLGDVAPNPERDSVERALRGEPVPEPTGALGKAQHRAARGMPAEGASESLLRVVVKALEATGLMDKLQAVHRQYVEDTLELLKKGQLDDALKRAVPLARPGVPGPPPRPSLGMPNLRPNLDIPFAPRAPSSSNIMVEGDLYSRMRDSYRAAAKKLEKEGRFKEAAFVYVELLGEIAEAVAVLERSGKRELHALAAELAESHGLAPDVVVRQWLLAKDVARALEHARRHRAFAGAVTDLERTGKRAEAVLLRREWAAHLARTSSFGTAVEVLWSIRNESTAIMQDVNMLLDAGIAAQGQDLPTLIARRIELDVAAGHTSPGMPPRDLGMLAALVDDDGPGAVAARLQLAYALGSPHSSLRTATSALVRALCADAAAGTSIHLKPLTERLADDALRFDMPAPPPRPPGRHPAEVLVLDGPPGNGVAEDVALLPGGRVLVGLGEAGACVVTRSGGIASRSGEPTSSIVMSANGARAFLIAKRGELLRISRYDTGTGSSAHWIDVRAHCFAGNTDGDLLFVGRRDELIALDALAPAPRVLWQTTLPNAAVAVECDTATLAVVFPAINGAAAGHRVATFDGRTLARRDEWAVPLHDTLWLNARGDVLGLDWPAQAQVTPPGIFQLQTPAGSTPTHVATLGPALAAVAFEGDDASGIVAHARGNTRLVIHLDARVVAMRAHETSLVVADDRGRVFVVDTIRGLLEQHIALP